MPFKNPHPLYSAWQAMLRRCDNKNHPSYHRYGGRGINVCERWLSFHNFIADMGPRPNGCTIDRIDNDKGYSPENCRWATRKEQQRNQSTTRKITIDGILYIAADLAEISGMKADAIVERANRGLSYADVVSQSKLHNLSGLSLGAKISSERRKARETCKRGHAFTIDKHGKRKCNTCRAILERARRLCK